MNKDGIVYVCLVTGAEGAGKTTLIENMMEKGNASRILHISTNLRNPGKLEDDVCRGAGRGGLHHGRSGRQL